jgi:AraC-like DNA-binding protein
MSASATLGAPARGGARPDLAMSLAANCRSVIAKPWGELSNRRVRVENSITSVAALVLIGAAAEQGLSAVPLFEAVGLDPSAAPEPERHIPALAYLELWDSVVQKLNDPGFAARTGMAFQLEALEGFGFLAMSCATLAQAYERTKAYRSLYNVGSAWELEEAGPRVRMRWEPWRIPDAPEAGRRAANEYHVAEMLASARTLVGDARLVPSRLCFRHPAGSLDLGPIFGKSPESGAEFDGFEVPRELLERPLLLANAALKAYFEKQCKEASFEFEADARVTGSVRRHIIAGMNGQLPSMLDVARGLGLSVRSLHRALEAEGTKFNAIVDDVRREFSERYLARQSLNIGEVSYLVGFSDTSAFFKAFKRWTGKKPSEYRAALAP